MKLDNEEQRGLLIKIVASTNIQGDYIQVKEAVKLVDKLLEDIQNAEIVNAQ